MKIYTKKHLRKVLNVQDDIDLKNLKIEIFNNTHVSKVYINKKNNKKLKENELGGVKKEDIRETLNLLPQYKVVNRNIRKKILLSKINKLKQELKIMGGIPKGVDGEGNIIVYDYKHNIDYHKNSLYRCNIDIKSFFPSTPYIRIYNYFIENYEKDIATILSYFCCYNSTDKDEIVLAQGFPTSMDLVFLVNEKMIRDIQSMVENKGYLFSILVDDIVISGQKKIEQSLIDGVIGIINKNSYKVNKKKINNGVKKKIHGVKKYNGSKSKSNNYKKLKKIYDKLIQIKISSIEEYKNIYIPLLSQYQGLYQSLKYIDKNLIPEYHRKLYKNRVKQLLIPYTKKHKRICCDYKNLNRSYSIYCEKFMI